MLEKKWWVIDTSVLINLIASGEVVQILAGLSSEVLITDQVRYELKKHPRDGSDCSALINALIEQSLLKPVKILPNILELYLDLTTELGDGEASVIAYTITQNQCAAVIDERKARRICKERFNLSPVFCTIDLFQDYFSGAEPDEQKFKQLLFDAVKIGRMRILEEEHEIWVRKILGTNLIQQCPSLKRKR